MEEKKKITIGLDLGIASVGWSILDTTNKDDIKIVNLGVRLFDECKTDANDERRSHRAMRRGIRRKRLRKDDLINLFVKYNFVDAQNKQLQKQKIQNILNNQLKDSNNKQIYPLQIKLKGLKQQLNNDELIICLYSYLKHRGAFYITDEQLNDLKTLEQENIFPSVQLNEAFIKEKKYIGLKQNINYKNEQYVKEIQELFNHQPQLSKEFQKEYLELFTRRRNYAIGPGSSIAPTPYGMWQLIDNKITKKPGNTLWEVNIGKCSVYENEYRGLASSPTCEFFNLLNDLCNLKVAANGNDFAYLNYKERKDFLDYISKKLLLNSDLKTKNEFNKTELKNTLNAVFKTNAKNKITIDNISGLKGTGKDKSEFNISKLSNLIICTKWLLNLHVLNSNEIDLNKPSFLKVVNVFYNDLAKEGNDVLSRVTVIEQFLKKYEINLNKDELNTKALSLLKQVSGFNKSSSLSYKAMNEFIDYFLNNEQTKVENSSTYFNPKIRKIMLSNPDFQNKKYFPKNYFENEILSKNAKRTFNQAINVINKIVHLYGKEFYIDNIVIEMAREKNSDEVKKYIAEQQRKNKNFKDQLNELAKKELGDDFDFLKLSSEKKVKLILWQEQNHIDIYDGLEIDLIDLINNFDKYHIDHIIPYSVCFIDSLNNKVLTKNENNMFKGNQTPYYWLSKIGKFEEFERRVNQIYPKKIKKQKNNNLLYKDDIYKKDNQLGFIATNLVDTRISTKLLLNSLQTFFETNKKQYPNTKIKVINGSLTNYARYNLFVQNKKSLLPKDRNNYKHHAIDASIIAYMGIQPTLSKTLNYLNQIENQGYDASYYDPVTGELIDTNYEKALQINDKNRLFGSTLRDIYEDENDLKVKFSKLIITKKNMPLFGDTTFGIKKLENNEIIAFSKVDLLNTKKDDLANYFNSGKYVNSLLIYDSDKKIYSQLNEIYNQYNLQDNKTNPFILYINDLKQKQYPNIRDSAITLYQDNNFQKVTYVRYLKTKSVVTQYVQLKNKLNNEPINAIKTSSNFIEARIYVNDENKFIPINISSKFLTTNKETNKLMIDNDLLRKELDLLKINNKNKYVTIKNGTLITPNEKLLNWKGNIEDILGTTFNWVQKIKKDMLFQFIGSYNQANKIFELKLIDRRNSIFVEQNKEKVVRTNLPVKKLSEYFDFCQVDELGNIYNRKSLSNLLK